MGQVGSATIVVCREAFMRESVVEALTSAGINITGSHRFIEGALFPEDIATPDLVLYIDAGHSERNSARDAGKIAALPRTNWLVMCEDSNNPVLASLRELRLPASAAPLDVSRDELAFLARIAGMGRRIFIDDFCQNGSSDEIAALRRLDLDPQQWSLLRYLSSGMSNKMIANRLGTSEAMVKVQIRALLCKLGVANRTQAAVMAARAGLRHETAAAEQQPEAALARAMCTVQPEQETRQALG